MLQSWRYILLTALLLLALAGRVQPALAASGQLSGDVTVGSQWYSAEIDGHEVERDSSLYQQYTLTYRRRATLGDTRLGSYTLLIGYEFNAIDPERTLNGARDTTVSSISASKLYYDAGVILAPGGLPFRLSLFAQDLNRSSFVERGFTALPAGNQSGRAVTRGHLIEPDIVSDLMDGTHRQIGGTLLVGIRNGSYLGAYRDLLSQLPRLLVDYKQEDVKDDSSQTFPQHYRSRDLAFVSLNKKDNWVHFRMRDHQDFLRPENNVRFSQVMIGTIDHVLDRRWINLTNWIKLSGDFSFSSEDQASYTAPERLYALNLLALGRREKLNGSILSSFTRRSDDTAIDLDAALPITLVLDRDRDTQIRSRLVAAADEHRAVEGYGAPSGTSSAHDLYLDNQVSFFRTRAVLVTPRIEVESRNESAEDKSGLALRLGVDAASNSQRDFGWVGGYTLTMIESASATRSGTYLQNELYGSAERNLSRNLRIGGRVRFVTGNGFGESLLSFRIPTIVGTGNFGTDEKDESSSVSLMQTHASAYGEHVYQRLRNRLEISASSLSNGEEAKTQSEISHVLGWETNASVLKWQTQLNFSEDGGGFGARGLNYVSPREAGSDVTSTWTSSVNYEYTPDRRFSGSLLGLSGGTLDGNVVQSYTVSEKLLYRMFTVNGIVRRILELSEEIGYEAAPDAVDSRDTVLFGRFSAAYYPKKFLYAKLSTERVNFLASGASQQALGGEVGLDYQKLKVTLSYSSATKARESETLPELMEQRWDLKVKKIF